ncbi:hypothetical protein [Sphingobacterium detergens]|uniref:Uncharacterized protein n=1 Tax=Sphingobacterium detergens TaxID=1145106 RepID=A0A420ARP4_SPHD1|nr:hypothetical protein [Sphingobacterium detergens]RKE47151.1 hypothetical protein DFQ12_4312 [Sphingobacterium detergens]
MSAQKSISTKAYQKETKQHLLSKPDKAFQKNKVEQKNQQQIIKSMEIPNQISAVANIILKDWKKPYFGAVPYLNTMVQLDNINQMYDQDSAKSIVRYFLANAQSWKGETARAVKAKLNQLLKN